MSAEPFHITADPAFLYLSPGHKEALGCIIYGIEQRKGFVAISGEIGVGKTTILRAYLEGVGVQGLRKPERVIYIFNANLSFPALLHTIFNELDLAPRSKEIHEIVNQLQETLIEIYKKGETVVLVVDEAQNMPVETLENLRMLSNLETIRDKLIQIILVGQPEFEAMLSSYELRQLNQRIAIRTRIKPLTEKDSIQYIYHRLARVTDEPSEVFTDSAVHLIARHGRGAPRVLNILADNALIAGFGYQKKPVNKKIVREVAADYFGADMPRRFRWPVLIVASCAVAAGLLFIPFRDYVLKERNPQVKFESSFPKTGGSAGNSGPSSHETVKQTIHYRAEPVDEPRRSEETAGDKTARAPGPSPAVDALHESRQDQDAASASKSLPPAQPDPSVTRPAAGGRTSEATDVVSGRPVSGALPEKPTRWVVKQGDNLSMIALSIYGKSDQKTLDWIRSLNPEILDPNILRTGLILNLPARDEQAE